MKVGEKVSGLVYSTSSLVIVLGLNGRSYERKKQGPRAVWVNEKH